MVRRRVIVSPHPHQAPSRGQQRIATRAKTKRCSARESESSATVREEKTNSIEKQTGKRARSPFPPRLLFAATIPPHFPFLARGGTHSAPHRWARDGTGPEGADPTAATELVGQRERSRRAGLRSVCAREVATEAVVAEQRAVDITCKSQPLSPPRARSHGPGASEMTVNDYKEIACATADVNEGDEEEDVETEGESALNAPTPTPDSENLLGRVLAGNAQRCDRRRDDETCESRKSWRYRRQLGCAAGRQTKSITRDRDHNF